jgi:hypothetical protein
MGVPVNKTTIQTALLAANAYENPFKAREFANPLKEKLNQYLYKILNEENNISPNFPISSNF